MPAETINQERLKQVLVESVSINSVSGKEQEVTSYFEDVLKNRGFHVQRQIIDEVSGRANLLAEKGTGAVVLFYGHMDTVDTTKTTSPESWKTDPIKLEGGDGRHLYGLGASDMKGGIAAFIEAASATNTPVKILLGVDEEADSAGTWEVVKKRPDFFKGVTLIISAEPSLGLKANQITTGRTGRILYDARFGGKGEHIMKYDQAVDSIGKLMHFGHQLYLQRDGKETFASGMTVVQIREIHGASVGMSVCGEASAIIEALLGPEDNSQDILTLLRTMVKDKDNDTISIRARKTPYLSGYRFYNFPGSEIIANIIEKRLGTKMDLVFRRSVADDNILATLNIPVITWGPQGGNEHLPNEYVESESLITLANMYKEFLDEIGKGDKK